MRGLGVTSEYPRLFVVSVLTVMLVILAGAGSVLAAGPEFDPDATVVLAIEADVPTMDIHATTQLETMDAWFMVGDTLVSFDWEGNLIPLLAESWEVSDDALNYTFYLRDDVVFHSGKPFTAHDVKATFDRWLGMPSSPTRDNLGDVKAVEVLDDYTVQIQLNAPFNSIWGALTGSEASIINIDNVNEYGDRWGAPGTFIDGTGPFKLVQWVPGQHMVYERHDAYTWGPEAYENRGPAHVKQVRVRIIPEAVTVVSELIAGGIDGLPKVPGTEVDRLRSSPNVTLFQYAPPSITFYGMNVSSWPLDDVRVRRALAHAMDKEQYNVVARSGVGEAAPTFMRPGVLGYREDLLNYALEFDVAEANRLLDEAGWTERASDGIRMKDGRRLTIEFAVYNDASILLGAQLSQAHARVVGIDLQLRVSETAAFLEYIGTGQHQLFPLGTHYARRGAYQVYWYHHPDNRPNPNRFYYENDELTAYLEKAVTTGDIDEMTEAYVQAERILLQDAVWIPMVYRNELVAWGPRLVDPRFDHPMMRKYKLLDLKVLADR